MKISLILTERKIEKVDQEKFRNIDKELEEEFDLTTINLDESRSRFDLGMFLDTFF